VKEMPALTETDLSHILEHTVNLWDELRGQRIFITGGTGFFGCWLLESFAYANDKLGLNASALVLTRDYKAFKLKAPHLATHPAIRFLDGDVRTFGFPVEKFSHIVHGAVGSAELISLDYGLNFFGVALSGTRRVLEFARYCKAKKFLFTSSGAVYGKQPASLSHISEEYLGAPDPLNVCLAYGEGKRLAEHLCAQYARSGDLQTKMARCFAFVGPYLPLTSNFAIGNFIRDGFAGGPIKVKGDGTPYRSYLYAADLAIWLWTILFRGESCVPYNVGSEHALTIAELANMVATCFPQQIMTRIMEEFVAGEPWTERYVPSTQRARKELGLKQTIDLVEAIRRTIRWYSFGGSL